MFTNERIAQLDESPKGKDKFIGDSMMISDINKIRKERKKKKRMGELEKRKKIIRRENIIKDKNSIILLNKSDLSTIVDESEVRKYIDKTIKCIVEGYTDDGVIIMRSEHDAPEIDGLVYATSNREVIPGDIETVKITKADEYDLFGEIIEE